MARSNTQRYTGALKYINDNVSAQLALSIVTRNLNQEAVGASLSLSGGGFWHTGNDDQHMALRALLLCQQAFFTVPGCMMAGGLIQSNADAKRFFKGQSEARIIESIRAYEPVGALAPGALAAVAAARRRQWWNFSRTAPMGRRGNPL